MGITSFVVAKKLPAEKQAEKQNICSLYFYRARKVNLNFPSFDATGVNLHKFIL